MSRSWSPRKAASLAAAVVLGLIGPAPALAQDRSPPQRQAVADLAYVLGESHALRQLCAGTGDQFWRERMQRLLAAEAPDPGFDRRLKEAFNTGFASAQSAFPSCGAESRREAERVAARGRALAQTVAR